MFHNLKPLALVVLLAFPLAADAQQHRGRAHPQRAHPQKPQTPTPRAQALAPPPQLAQALLPAGARRVNERVWLTRDGQFVARDEWKYRQQSNRWWKHYGNQYPLGSYYAVPYTGGYGFTIAGEDEREPEAPPPAAMAANKGLLQFDIIPPSGLDYYIDGVHMGSSSNLGSEFEVNAGARQIEVRAYGYKPSTFDKRIEEGRITTIRGALEPLPQAQAPASAASRVMYVIPGCYMGNTKPSAAALPSGCDIKKLVRRGL
jgi:hypothetical protein